MIFAYHIVVLLSSSKGWMIYDDFLAEYQRRTKSSHLLYPTDYGFPTMARLFEAIRLVVQVRSHMLVVNPDFQSLALKQSPLLWSSDGIIVSSKSIFVLSLIFIVSSSLKKFCVYLPCVPLILFNISTRIALWNGPLSCVPFLCLLSEGQEAVASFLFVFIGQSSDSSLKFSTKTKLCSSKNVHFSSLS